MWKLIYKDDFWIGEGRRIVLKLIKVEKDKNFPQGLEFAVQYLFQKDEEWIQIARIDNQMHEGKPGTHIHVFGSDHVKWEDISFRDSRKRIIEIGEKIIRQTMW